MRRLLAVVLTAAATATACSSASGPTAGPTSTTRPGAYYSAGPNPGYDVTNYLVRLSYAPRRGAIRATTYVTATATRRLTHFTFDLHGLRVTEAFVKASSVPVHVPLSGKTMEFDASGKCTAGC